MRYIGGLLIFFACSSAPVPRPVHSDWNERPTGQLDDRAVPTSYQVDLEFPAIGRISGRETIQFEAQRTLLGLWLHSGNLTVQRVEIMTEAGAIAADWTEFPGDELLLIRPREPIAKGSAELTLSYEINGFTSRGISKNSLDDHPYMTATAMDGAGRYLAPSFDERGFTAEVDFIIRVPAGSRVVGGGFAKDTRGARFRQSLGTLSDISFVIGKFTDHPTVAGNLIVPDIDQLPIQIDLSGVIEKIAEGKERLASLFPKTEPQLLVFDRFLDVGPGVAVFSLGDSQDDIDAAFARAHSPTRWGDKLRADITLWFEDKLNPIEMPNRTAMAMLISWYGQSRFVAELAIVDGKNRAPIFSSADASFIKVLSSNERLNVHRELTAAASCADESNHSLDLAITDLQNDERVPMCFRYGDRKNLGRECMWMESPTQKYKLALKYCPTWMMMNADGVGAYRTNYDESAWREVAGAPLPLTDTERALLLSDALWFAGRGKAKAVVPLTMISRFARTPKPELWVAAAKASAELAPLVPTDVAEQYRLWVQKLFVRPRARSRRYPAQFQRLSAYLDKIDPGEAKAMVLPSVSKGEAATEALEALPCATDSPPSIASEDCAQVAADIRQFFSKSPRR